jgi:uncharacterized protein YfaS (alpha-2-macroglobulin family)
VTAACRPNAYVTATVVRPIDPDAAWRVHRASARPACALTTPTAPAVEIAAPEEIRPSTTLSAQVRVTSAGGQPAPDTAVTVAAVDEGICRLTNFATPDPFGFSRPPRRFASAKADLYGQLMPEVPRPTRPAPPAATPLRPRTATARLWPPSGFKPVALFSGVLRTDASGVARVDLPVPQFAGELRLMAVALPAAAGGSAESDSGAAPGFGSPTTR